jgi:hypothetical protein
MAYYSLGVFLPFLPLLKKIGSRRFRRFVIDLLPSKRVRKVKNIVDLIDHTSKEILERKKASLSQDNEVISEQIHESRDIMSLLCKFFPRCYHQPLIDRSVRENILAKEADRLPDDELIAQMRSLLYDY